MLKLRLFLIMGEILYYYPHNFLFFVKDFLQVNVYVSPLAGLKIIIRLTQGFATLTLGFYVAGPLGRQAYMRQSASITLTAAKRQKPKGRHIEAQGKPGRQARRSPG